MNTIWDHGFNASSLFTNSDDDVSVALLTATHSINLILSLPTNSYVVWLIATGAGGTMASEFFALNLAVSNLLYCLSNILFFPWLLTLNTQICKVLSFLSGLYISSLFQCCICVEHYLAVVHPVVFLRFKPLRYRVACCSVVWLLELGICIGSVFESFLSLDVYIMLGFYILMFLIMLFCCVSVLRALKRPGPGEGARERDREGGNIMKRKAFKIILIIMMSAFLNHLSFVVVIPMQGYFSKGKFFFALSITASVSTMTWFVQPLIFLHRVGKLPCIKGL